MTSRGERDPWETGLEYSTPERHWQPDQKSSSCPCCNSPFSVVVRKHHCRRCGLVVCDRCSVEKLSLPDYSHEERVCSACRRTVLKLREFMGRHSEVMAKNISTARLGCVNFMVYQNGQEPFRTPVWLSTTLLMLCWEEKEEISGLPVHMLERVTEGFQTTELKSRLKSTVLCCITVDNTELSRKEDQFLSLHFRDGRTLDLEAPNNQARNDWSAKFLALLAVVPFAEYHHTRGQVDVRRVLQLEQNRVRQSAVSSMKATRGGGGGAGAAGDSSGRERKERATADRERLRKKYQKLKGDDS